MMRSLACLAKPTAASLVSIARRPPELLACRYSSSLPHDNPPNVAAADHPTTTPSPSPRARRRKRPSFDNLDDVPSFQVFQQRSQVRSLYRQYLRTIGPLDASQRNELLQQIQFEFRKQQATSSDSSTVSKNHWETQRGLSEGTRRLKELGTMLGTVVKLKHVDDTTEPSLQQPKVPENPWPWQQ